MNLNELKLTSEERIIQLERSITQLAVLYSIASSITVTTEVEKVLELVLETSLDTLKAEVGAIFFLEDSGLELKISKGGRNIFPVSIRLDEDEKMASRVAHSGCALWIAQPETGSVPLDMTVKMAYPLKSIICFPIKVSKRVLGVIYIGRFCPEEFTEEQRWLLNVLTNRAAVAIESARLYRELKEKAEELEHLLEELKQTQTKLIYAEKLAAVTQIASEAAHEVKNPLAVIKAGLYYLEKILPENEKAQKTLSRMDEATERATTYINDLLNFSRPPVLVLSRVEINDLLKKSIQELPVLAGIKIERDFAADLPLLNADPDRLGQVFINLLKNAAEAMGEVRSKKLEVRIEKDGEFVKIHISDTGHGIPEEDTKRIFDPFFTTKGKGTGLGLAICQRIIEAHKGEIGVTSEVGKGTTFVVKLPVTILK